MAKRYVAVINISEISDKQVASDRNSREMKTVDSEQKSAITVRANSTKKLEEKVNAAVKAIFLGEED